MVKEAMPKDTPGHNFKNYKEAELWAKQNIVGIYKNTSIEWNFAFLL